MAVMGINEEELFASGHRACAGCGEVLALRHILKSAGRDTIVAQATGCMEVVSTPYPQTSWEIPFVHCAFQNAPAVASGVRAALNMKGKKDTNVIAMGGDGAMFDIGFGSLSGAIERGHKILYIVTDNEAYMNCLALDSLIMTKEGLKKIIDITIGDEVYAFAQKTGKLVLKKCTGVFDNGIKRVYEIDTGSQTIKATGNHPFLTLQRNGRGKESKLIWKNVEDLIIGDEIVTLKEGLKGKSFKFEKIQLAKKGDYKVNKIREVQIPKQSSKDVMKLLGLYVGDGWTRVNKAELGFSVPTDNRARKPVKQLLKKVFNTEPNRETKEEVYLDSINVAKFIDSLGFEKGAKNKMIPAWVFSLPFEEKKAFVEGLLLSDGNKQENSFRYISSSKELLRTLRLLLQTMNIRVGKIHQQTKKKGTIVVGKKLKKDSTYGYIAFSFKKGAKANYPSQYKYSNFLYGNKNFEMRKVVSKKVRAMEPTLDLRVEGEHNFIANGIVVHNTGIQRSGATFPFAATTTSPAGKVIPGKQQPKKPLPFILAAHGIEYAATASVANLVDLKMKVEKALKVEGPSFLHVFTPCIPGWKIATNVTITVAKKAISSWAAPLYEIEKGVLKLSQKPEITPIEEYLMMQGRFKHVTPDQAKKIQEYIGKRKKFLEENDGKEIFDLLY